MRLYTPHAQSQLLWCSNRTLPASISPAGQSYDLFSVFFDFLTIFHAHVYGKLPILLEPRLVLYTIPHPKSHIPHLLTFSSLTPLFCFSVCKKIVCRGGDGDDDPPGPIPSAVSPILAVVLVGWPLMFLCSSLSFLWLPSFPISSLLNTLSPFEFFIILGNGCKPGTSASAFDTLNKLLITTTDLSLLGKLSKF